MAEKKKLTDDQNTNDSTAIVETPDVVAQAVEMFQVGHSGNRPSDPPVNFIYYSIDNGKRERYLGDGNWELIDNLHG